MADEGFHEIQLGKKQLFFAFMAAALYSVVVFSLGVWVGQDVRRPDSEIAADASPDAPADSTPEPTKVAPNELDYAARLQTDGKGATAPAPDAKPVEPPSPPESVAATEVKTAPPPAPADTKAAAPAPEKAAPKAAAPPPAGKSSSVTLQVAAFGDQATAGNLATRLKAKGYAAYVFDGQSGPSRFKVRVGPLADKSEADKVSARIKRDEGLSPFITR
jgi:DedD protein